MRLITRLRLISLIVATVLTGAPLATAQDSSGQPDNRRAAHALVNALDQYALVEARRALQLSENQYSQFVPRLKALQQTQRRLQQARRAIIQELRRLAGARASGPPDEAGIRERLTALREHDERAAAELRAAHQALDEVLSLPQQARFRLFEESIEARKLELLVRARARAGRGGS